MSKTYKKVHNQTKVNEKDIATSSKVRKPKSIYRRKTKYSKFEED